MAEHASLALRLGPLGSSQLRVHRLRGREALSELYSFDIVISTSLPDTVVERALLGRSGGLAMSAHGYARAVHGMVSGVTHLGALAPLGVDRHLYMLRFVPRAWLLTQKKTSRVFQDKSIVDVVREVLEASRIAVQFDLERTYPKRKYLTQYEETDWDFVTRLAAENGLLFRFEQPASLEAWGFVDELARAAGASADLASDLAAIAGEALDALLSTSPLPPAEETLVFTDATHYPPVSQTGLGGVVGRVAGALGLDAPAPSIPLRPAGALASSTDDFLLEIELGRFIRPTLGRFGDYDPRRPLTILEAEARPAEGPLSGPLSSSLSGLVSGSLSGSLDGLIDSVAERALDRASGELEIYEHGGRELFPDWDYSKTEPERMLRAHRRRERPGRGASVSARLEPGRRFLLEGHVAEGRNVELVVTEVEHEASSSGGAQGGGASYQNRFACVPRDVVYTPRRPERPRVHVALTARVVGPDGEEIHTNEQGEIKVKFHWDRDRGNDTDASCWIRTMQTWAGANWGAQFIPRVGMEVVVVFEGGDPDKPLVLGSVYNGVTPTPFALPRNKTVSGIRTQSTPHKAGFNELSFEDAANQERIFLRAERDFDAEVEHDRTAHVGHDDTTEVVHDQLVTVGGARTVHVTGEARTELRADAHLDVRGRLSEHVHGHHTEHVARDLSVLVDGSEHRRIERSANLSVGGCLAAQAGGGAALRVGSSEHPASATASVEGRVDVKATKSITLISDAEIVLKCADSFIRIGPNTIELVSPKIIQRAEDARLTLASGEAKFKVSSAFQVVSDGSIVLKATGASLGLSDSAKLAGAEVALGSSSSASDSGDGDPPEPAKIELVDQDGNPVPHQRFRVRLGDGTEYTGYLDEDGKAEIFLEGSGEIDFPDLAEVSQ
ncbi:MAG: type VI secretion system tip protein TssI/VgrG [Polyangiaceae bacterium]